MKDGRGMGESWWEQREMSSGKTTHFAVDKGWQPVGGCGGGRVDASACRKTGMKTRIWAFLIGLVVVVGVVTAFATGDADEAADGTADNVFLGELDLAERMEIWRNQFRRMTPGDEPLVQDVGTWPAAWEEFSSAWDAAPAERDFATWLVPFSVERTGALTVLRDANGNSLWSGATDFAKEGSESVTLTGALLPEEDWAPWEAARSEIARRLGLTREGETGGRMRGWTNGPCTTGIHFVSAEADFATNPPELRVGLAWTNAGTLDVFAYGPLHTSETHVATYTNDENEVITWTNTMWYYADESYTGFGNAWEWLGTVAIADTNPVVFVDTNFPPERGQIRYYAAAEAIDSDGDGLGDGFEMYVSHSSANSPDGDGDGVDDATEYMSGSSAGTSNLWWTTKTTNDSWIGYGYHQFPYQEFWDGEPVWWTNLIVTGVKPVSNAVPVGVKLWGMVDDVLMVDSNEIAWTHGPTQFSNFDVTASVTNLASGRFRIDLFDWPDLPNGGANEVWIGDAAHPFRVVWEWLVPMDFRLEHVYTYGAPLVVNPSGSCTNRPFLCEAGVLPANIPDESICWSCTNAGTSFSGGVTNGRMVELTGTTPGDWEATVTVQDSTLPPSKLRGKILEKKTVMVYLHIVRKDDGTSPAFTVAHFNDLLDGANEIHQQSGMEFVLAANVVYTNKTEWLEISTTDDWAEYHDLQSIDYHTGGIEVYCINSFEGGQQNGLSCNASNRAAGITISQVSTARTLAHELGHACGLLDVYVNQKDGDRIVSIPDEPVTQEWLPGDWCAEAPNGGYGQLTQHPLLRRVLMYGVENENAVDIPNGSVYGYDRNVQTGLVAVGITNMTREPHHW